MRRGYPPELYEKILSLTGVPVSLLDVATGTGTVIRDLKESLCDAVGIDSDPERIRVAKFLTTAHIGFQCAAIEKFSPERQYDLVTVAQAFESLPMSALRTVHRALKPDGIIAIFWKYPDPYSRTSETVNSMLREQGLPERTDMGLRLAQLNLSGLLTEWRFRNIELSLFKSQELFSHEDGVKSILWGLGAGNGVTGYKLGEIFTRELAQLLPGSITEIYDCYLWTAQKDGV